MSETAPKLNPVQSRAATALYAGLYMRMIPVAESLGYALALHGSMARDLDVVAIPWTWSASPAEELVKKLVDEFGFYHMVDTAGSKKPHGRKAWCLGWDAGLYLDLSVVPVLVSGVGPEALELGVLASSPEQGHLAEATPAPAPAEDQPITADALTDLGFIKTWNIQANVREWFELGNVSIWESRSEKGTWVVTSRGNRGADINLKTMGPLKEYIEKCVSEEK